MRSFVSVFPETFPCLMQAQRPVWPVLEETSVETSYEPVESKQSCENPPDRSKHYPCDDISWIVRADVDTCETDQSSDCIQGDGFTHPQLEMVDEQGHQEKYLGCMTTGEGITFFPPADDACLFKSKKWTVPVRKCLNNFHQ